MNGPRARWLPWTTTCSSGSSSRRPADLALADRRRPGGAHGSHPPRRRRVAVRHTLLAGHAVHLSAEPLCTWRDAHGERHARRRPTRSPDHRRCPWSRTPTGSPGRASSSGTDWYLGAYHREEAARGLESQSRTCCGSAGSLKQLERGRVDGDRRLGRRPQKRHHRRPARSLSWPGTGPGGCRAGAGRPDRSGSLALAADTLHRDHRHRRRRGGRISVVRRLVARHDDRL